jgi:hypothetical protein
VTANVVRTVTANDTALITDCGKTLNVTGANLVLTLPSVSGFPATCVISYKNAHTSRGQQLSGFPADLRAKMYPLQAWQVQIVSGAWSTSVNPGRWLVTSPITINVNQNTGGDTNDCLATAAQACSTFDQAMTDISKNWDVRSGVTIQFGCTTLPCTYLNKPLLVQDFVTTGNAATITINGDGVTPTNFLLTCNADCGSPTNNCLICYEHTSGKFFLSGFALSTTGAATSTQLIAIQNDGTWLQFGFISFGVVTGSANHIFCQYGSIIEDINNFSITGGVTGTGSHAEIENGCILHERIGTATITGTPAFTQFVKAHNVGIIGITAGVFSGSATGVKCVSDGNSVIDAGGGAASLPGNSSCTTATGGQVQ